jgi:hypothetical protein
VPLSCHHADGPIGQLYEALDGDALHEIDLAVVDIATDPELFSNVAGSAAGVEVVLGDGRLVHRHRGGSSRADHGRCMFVRGLPSRVEEITMALDERARRQLHARLEAVLGPEEAMILMEHLPPLGWSEVATSRDLEAVRVALSGELGGQIAELRGEIAELRGETLERIAGQTRSLIVAMVGTNAALATLVLAAVTLT